MLVASSERTLAGSAPSSLAAASTVCCAGASAAPSPLSDGTSAGASVSAIRPYAPSVLGFPVWSSQSVSLYDTDNSTLCGTLNSLAAAANSAARLGAPPVGASSAAADAGSDNPAPRTPAIIITPSRDVLPMAPPP